MSRLFRTTLLALPLCAAVLTAQIANDTALFEIALNDDSTSLLFCKWGGEVKRSLSGPVLMADNQLLFYSENGYILYDQNGAVVDSHSLFDDNKGLAPGDPARLLLSQPIDQSTLLYFRKTPQNGHPVAIFQKKLGRKRLKPIKDEEYARFGTVGQAQLINIAHNVITDEMGAKAYLEPQLVGFSPQKRDARWWTLDKFYSFSSPLIYEREGEYGSFFPGMKSSSGAAYEVKRDLVEPLATFVRDGRRYYVGVYATLGTAEDRYYQKLYVCDEAGNILYADTLLKQTNTEVILGEVKEEKMYYTARQTKSFVFQPALSSGGTVYYGIIDYEEKTISVRKKAYRAYRPVSAQPDLAHLIDVEKEITYEPVGIGCQPGQQGYATIPHVMIRDEKGQRRKAIARDLVKSEFLVRIFRQQYRDIGSKLGRRRSPLPEAVDAIRDSISKEATAGCPYVISLSGPKGILRSFDYAPGERVLCARVVAVTASRQVLVRVDLKDYAEVLVFDEDGHFVNRFTFNAQDYTRRKDIVVALDKSPILELDYETQKGGAFLEWAPVAYDQ